VNRALFDIEANAIEAELVTEVWSLVLLDLDTEDMVSVSPESSPADWGRAIALLEHAHVKVGHNIAGYDCPALRRIYGAGLGGLAFLPGSDQDTLVMARLARPDLKGHSLAAWGERLGHPKGDTGTYERWTPRMQGYCEQDVRVNFELYKYLVKEHPWLISAR